MDMHVHKMGLWKISNMKHPSKWRKQQSTFGNRFSWPKEYWHFLFFAQYAMWVSDSSADMVQIFYFGFRIYCKSVSYILIFPQRERKIKMKMKFCQNAFCQMQFYFIIVSAAPLCILLLWKSNLYNEWKVDFQNWIIIIITQTAKWREIRQCLKNKLFSIRNLWIPLFTFFSHCYFFYVCVFFMRAKLYNKYLFNFK